MRAPTVQGMLDLLRGRKKAYQVMFKPDGVIGNEAMIDLAKFCRLGGVGWTDNALMQSRLIGRHEVFNRIAQHLHLEPEHLAALYRVTVEGTLQENE